MSYLDNINSDIFGGCCGTNIIGGDSFDILTASNNNEIEDIINDVNKGGRKTPTKKKRKKKVKSKRKSKKRSRKKKSRRKSTKRSRRKSTKRSRRKTKNAKRSRRKSTKRSGQKSSKRSRRKGSRRSKRKSARRSRSRGGRRYYKGGDVKNGVFGDFFNHDNIVHLRCMNDYKVINMPDGRMNMKFIHPKFRMGGLLLYHQPRCPYCRDMHPIFSQLATKLTGKIPIGAIDCSDVGSKNDLLADFYKISVVPKITFYAGHDKEKYIDYSGGRNINEILEFIAKLNYFLK